MVICDPDEPARFLKGDLGEFRCAVYDAGDNDHYIIWEFEDTNFTWLDPEGEYEYFANEEIWYELNVPGSWKVTCTVVNPTGKAVASDQITVYVLWVDLELLSSGACPQQDNDKYDTYVSATRPNPPGRDTLGLGEFMKSRRGWGVAAHGAVTPPEWPDPLALQQRATGVTYNGVNGDQVNESHDDDDDTRAAFLDETKPHLYYMDYPGVRVGYDDWIHRMRANFTNVVYMGQEGGRVRSNTVECSTAQSWHWDGGAQAWCTFTDPQVATTPGDNNLWVGSQLNGAELDWDMQ